MARRGAYGSGAIVRNAAQRRDGRDNHSVPRRKREGIGRRLPVAAPRPPSHRSHWRADGSPKTAYRTQRDALSVADERRTDAGVDLNVYVCTFCSAWHVGNADVADSGS
jgi:hypothetical protein